MFAYGPVPSRRLGRSIGVSPIPPKTCSYSCVYCQLGRTNHLQVKRESFYPKEEILNDIRKVIENAPADYVTFVGDGEPTLCKDLGWLIHESKKEFSLPIAVITNGSLLYREDVRNDLEESDIVLPTLDAGTQEIFKEINRPHKKITFDKMLKGLIDFRKEYPGKIWLEVMLVKNLNDTKEALKRTRTAIKKIGPDRVYIVTPIRPPAESWVEPTIPDRILLAQKILGESWDITGRENGEFGVSEFSNAREAIYEICSRHPLRENQALEIERKFSQKGAIEYMVSNSELVKIEYQGETYILPKKFVIR